MKLYCTLILSLFCVTNFFAQSICGVVRDSISKKPIEAVNFTMISGRQSVSANKLGKYQIMINDINDKLLVSCVGYQSIIIDLSNFLEKKDYLVNLSLIPHVEELKDIVITNISQGNYILKKIGLRKAVVLDFSVQFGHEVCTLVTTPYKEEQYLKKVLLSVEKRFNRDYFLTHFKINFYEYDENHKKPGAKINIEDVIVFPENRSYDLIIDVNSLGIPFPIKGLCVGVEVINTYGIPYDLGLRDISSKEKLKNFKDEKLKPAPLLGFARSKNELYIQTWERNVNKQLGWSICPVKVTDKYSDLNLKVNVEIKIKKDEK